MAEASVTISEDKLQEKLDAQFNHGLERAAREVERMAAETTYPNDILFNVIVMSIRALKDND